MKKIFVVILMLALPLAVSTPSRAATFTVTNTNDSGAGSLRAAVADAAAVSSPLHDNTVIFNIPGAGVHTIQLTAPVPLKDVIVDGYTQPGSRANTLAIGSDAILTIEIDGSLAGVGAVGFTNQGTVQGAGIPNATIRGLVINRFSGGAISIVGPTTPNSFPGYLTITGCYIGTDPTGTQARGNGFGINLGTHAQVMIGDPPPDFGGNTTPFPAYRNVISGNVGAGIQMDSLDVDRSAYGTVRNAYIGTDASGTVALGNGGDGINIGPNGAVGPGGFGGFVYLFDNVIAANAGEGIDTMGIGTQAVNNYIGIGVDGRALGNQGNGAYFHGESIGSVAAPFGQIGVPGPGVANNAGAGVLVGDTALVDVAGRSYNNVGLGVDLSPLGHAANDVGDADTGPNDRLNYPVITSAITGSTTRIQGTLNTKANAQVEIRLYMNAICHPSGYGEGERYLTTVAATAAPDGNVAFDKDLGFAINAAAFPVVTAQTRRLAEDSRSIASAFEVSEYSPCVALAGAPPTPTISIDDVSLNEGNAGTTNATFTVSLSVAATTAVSVNYATADATATAGSDYTATSGTLNFSVGQITKTLTVSITGDTTVEANETLVVNLSAPSGATITKAQGTATITNDDVAPPPPLPTLSIDDVSGNEGNAGTATALFTVTLSAAAAVPVTVNYATADLSATAGSDYTAASGTLTFAAGQTTKTINVTVNGDTTVEPTETFSVTLSAPGAATIAKASGTGTITNDDVAPPPPGGGGGGGGGAMDLWLLAALALTLIAARTRRPPSPAGIAARDSR
ncbi:MAG: Calx-beta domain-containing protein [Pseudomonadota bacterium]